MEQILSLPDAGFDRERLRAGYPVDPKIILNLFDIPFKRLLAEKHIRIEWNPDESVEAAIDLANLKGTPQLNPVDQ